MYLQCAHDVRIYNVKSSVRCIGLSVMSTTRNSEKSNANVNIRIQESKRDFIDYAAELKGKNRSEFIIDSAMRAAEEAVLDQTVFHMSDDQHKAFLKALDEPVANEKLEKLLNTKSPWET